MLRQEKHYKGGRDGFKSKATLVTGESNKKKKKTNLEFSALVGNLLLFIDWVEKRGTLPF